MTSTLKSLTDEFLRTEAEIRRGGGPKAIERQHAKGRLTARERIARLVDPATARVREGAESSGAPAFDPHRQEIPNFQELGLWAAHGMYSEHGGAPAAGVVTGIGIIHGRRHMIIANDATVKAGAFFPMTCKKIIRAQHVARMARLPLVYLVDSAGVYLPMQEDVFPDTDDFGRIFFLNSVLSAEGVPQVAAIMGYCVAGGGYLPVLCDTLLMTEGSGLYLAGPALVKAAIGQDVSDEELGGASMHAEISGTIDFKEPDDETCLYRVRSIVSKSGVPRVTEDHASCSRTPVYSMDDIDEIFTTEPGRQYDVHDVINRLVDARAEPNDDGHESLAPDFDEYKPDYGASIVCGYARIGGHACGVVANQGKLTEQAKIGGLSGPRKSTNMPRVIYNTSADKAARFIMDCNQRKIPIIFLHDTTGFMVGRESEQGGIIRSGAKMVNAMSNSIVPKIVVIMGGSYGAGNYAMCGRAFEPFISFAWPCATCSVMGAAQATGTLAMIEERSRERKGETIDPETHRQILDAVRASYNEQQDIRYGAARGWVDRIIDPVRTRDELIGALEAAAQGWDYTREFKTGVLQT
ncbi:MAG: acyl-CoA carboxylase subunit beta [Planctomycetota bacterium]|nr:MAG: acyl-CoA carboxylase subunit beta [Planctomycetota bacterium]